MCQFVSDNRLTGKRPSEYLTLVDPPQALLNNTTLTTSAGTAHNPTFVIKVTVVFFRTLLQLRYLKSNLSITNIPPPSWPNVFSTGTLTLSNVTNAEPAVAEYEVLMGFVSTPSPRSMSITVKPSSVLHPTVKL